MGFVAKLVGALEGQDWAKDTLAGAVEGDVAILRSVSNALGFQSHTGGNTLGLAPVKREG